MMRKTRRVLSSLLCMLLLLGVWGGAAMAVSTNISYYMQASYDTPLYMTDNTSGGSYGTIQRGDIVGIISNVNAFYYVYIAGRNGYVLREACTYTSATNVTGAASGTVRYYLNTLGETYVYTNPSTSSNIQTRLTAGTSVGVVSQTGSFYQVYVNGFYGYVPTTALASGGITPGMTTAVSYYMTTIQNTMLYASASTGTNAYTSVPLGTSVGIIQAAGSFYYVFYNGYYGYIPQNHFSGIATNANAVTPNADGVVAYATVTPGASLYKSPGGTAVGTFSAGGQLGIISQTGTGYYYVKAGTHTGYILTSAASLASTGVNIPTVSVAGDTTTSTEGKAGTIVNCKNNVNFRAEASKNSTLLGAIDKGASVRILQKGKSYTKIIYGGQTGYVLNKYVK